MSFFCGLKQKLGIDAGKWFEKNQIRIFIFGGLYLFTACIRGHQVELPKEPAEKTKQTQGSDYIKSEAMSDFGEIKKYVLKAEKLSEQVKQLENAELVEVHLDEIFNVKAYQIVGADSATVLIPPRLYLKSTTLQGGLKVKSHEDGSVTVFVNAALVDGLDSFGETQFPKELSVENKNLFLKNLEEKLLKKPLFLADAPCPMEIYVKGESLPDVRLMFQTPLTKCPINRFFPAELKVRSSDWNVLMDSLLLGKKIVNQFNLEYQLPLLKTLIDLNLRKTRVVGFFRDVLSRREGGLFAAVSTSELRQIETDLRLAIEKSFGVSIGEELFLSVIETLRRELFVLEANDLDSNRDKVEKWILKGGVGKEGLYPFHLSSTEYYGKKNQIASQSPVTLLFSDGIPFTLKAKEEILSEKHDIDSFNSLLLTVFDGEILEFNFQELRTHLWTWETPRTQFFENPTCVDLGPVPTEEVDDPSVCEEFNQDCNLWRDCNRWAEDCTEWEVTKCRPTGHGFDSCVKVRTANPNDCSGYQDCTINRCTATRRYCAEPTHVCEPGHWYNTSCKRFGKKLVPTGEAPCLKMENHWQRVTTYAIPGVSSSWTSEKMNLEKINALIQNLAIHFEVPELGAVEPLDCLISQMDYRVLPEGRLLVIFRNTNQCRPFNAYSSLPEHGPTISVGYRLNLPVQNRCGEMIEDWKGQRKWNCRLSAGNAETMETTLEVDQMAESRNLPYGLYHSYLPRTEILGFSRTIGAYLESGESDVSSKY